MNHRTTPGFWRLYEALPTEIRQVADKNFDLLKRDPRHPSLRLKKAGAYWSVRIGLAHRALAVQRDSDLVWFWIGDHGEYDRKISGA